MTEQNQIRVFLSYSQANQDFVEQLARRLYGDARLAFWFAPWHSIPGQPLQEQMEQALEQAQACAVFVGGDSPEVEGWQNQQMRTAIQTRVEDETNYRVIPVLLPGTNRPKMRDLPSFLRLYEPVEFRQPDDEQAFKRLLAGILGLPPIQVAGYLESEVGQEWLPSPSSGRFEQGHAVIIGVAHYPRVRSLPETVLNDARDLYALLISPTACGYPPAPAPNATLLLDGEATGDRIRTALIDLAARTGPDDTVIVFFSGHGAYEDSDGEIQQYILPYDCDPIDLTGTAIAGDDMTALLRNIHTGRLLILFDSCHSGGAGDPKGERLPQLKTGLSESYYAGLAQGRGRVVIASCRADEYSWALAGMNHSLFTHYLLEALQGQAKTLGDGFVRVFDLFRYVADHVPARAEQIKASQHPLFKAAAVENDFPIALASKQGSQWLRDAPVDEGKV